MPSENWDTTSCVHPLHYLPSERRVAPCPPKARSADFSRTHALSYRPENGALIVTPHRQVSSCRESSLISTRNIVLFLPSAPRDVFLSIELNILSYYIIFRLHENWILVRSREWESWYKIPYTLYIHIWIKGTLLILLLSRKHYSWDTFLLKCLLLALLINRTFAIKTYIYMYIEK